VAREEGAGDQRDGASRVALADSFERSEDRPVHGQPAQTGVAVPRESQPAQPGMPFDAQGKAVPQEVVRAYGEFEKSANAELEKSVGGAIAQAMELALPNLNRFSASGDAGTQHAAPLRERLSTAVREEVEAGLKSDRQLGEQVARLLAGRRFDREARAQVVRLIDTRAQQLVPGAVRRVVSSWTNTALTVRGKETGASVKVPSPSTGRRASEPRSATDRERQGAPRPRRLDYGRMSDDEIMRL
jgi:hypothetical protein